MNNPQCQKLADRLLEAGDKSQAFFRELTADRWDQTIYSEGAKWCIREILAHFVVTEDAFAKLITNAIEDGDQGPEDFSIDTYNEEHVGRLRDSSPALLLERFTELRAQTVEQVRNLEDADLEKEGWHPYFGQAPVEAMLKLIYRHNQIHQRDIRKALEPPTE